MSDVGLIANAIVLGVIVSAALIGINAALSRRARRRQRGGGSFGAYLHKDGRNDDLSRWKQYGGTIDRPPPPRPVRRPDTTPICPLCGQRNDARPFIRNAISCSRHDCGMDSR